MRSPFDRGPASLSNLLDELQTQRERQQKEKFIQNATRRGSYVALPHSSYSGFCMRGGAAVAVAAPAAWAEAAAKCTASS